MAEDPSIDVTPVMNMFIILIPFLVSLAVFSHLSVLQFSLPSDGEGDGVSQQDQLPLVVVVESGGIVVTQGEFVLQTLPRLESGFDFAALTRSLVTIADERTLEREIVVAVADAIPFADIISCMDHCRAAGFSDVALANTTGEGYSASAAESTAGGDDASH